MLSLLALSAAAIPLGMLGLTAPNEPALLREFAAFLSVPNVAADPPSLRRSAELAQAMLERRGVATRLLDGEGGPPVVYGEKRVAGAKRTVVIYAHYDGQPVDPTKWASPPFTPTLLDGPREAGGKEIALGALGGPVPPEARLYARGASDDKGAIMALAAALDALAAAKRPLSVNLKVFFEGEEEAGSPHLGAVLQKNKDLLAADAWLFCDGPVHQSRRPVVFFGARGMVGLELTLYGPGRPLHSGHYGNWAPNPGMALATLVAGLHDADGRVAIDGFYDGVRPLTDKERDALRAVPPVEADLRRELLLAEGATPGVPVAEGILSPALNVRGLEAGRVGDAAANAIPTESRASFDFRLVPGQTPARLREAFEAHLKKHGYVVVGEEPSPDARRANARLVRLQWDAGYPASRAPMDSPLANAVVAAVGAATGQPVVRLPTLGGSIPMFLFDDVLGVPALGLPIANHDNNQHAANENLRMQNLRDGIAIFAAVLAEAGKAWP